MVDTGDDTDSATRQFVVGNGTVGGAFAVITLPMLQAPAPAVPGVNASVRLSADGSSPSPNQDIAGFQWTILSLPSRRLAASAVGRTANASLAPGGYEVGRA